MDLKLKNVFEGGNKPYTILGPCSAETRDQVMKTADMMNEQGLKPDLFRAGIWKPRTRPNSFEGVGKEGLKWMQDVRDKYGWKLATEVANTGHVFDALKAQIDVLWLGARTTVNPFSVQEVADALEGVDIPVLVKNPINPDLKLWMGGIERIYQAGITRLGVIHRGFSKFGSKTYRNSPNWQIPIDLKNEFPDIQIICDASHICGNRELLYPVSQMAMDMDFDGILLETHCNPDEAWSDAEQQVTPDVLKRDILDRLVVRNNKISSPEIAEDINDLRQSIDTLDKELLEVLSNRMKLAEQIGIYKKNNNIQIYQPDRWNDILEKMKKTAEPYNLSEEFLAQVLKAIHQESINRQENIMMN